MYEYRRSSTARNCLGDQKDRGDRGETMGLSGMAGGVRGRDLGSAGLGAGVGKNLDRLFKYQTRM